MLNIFVSIFLGHIFYFSPDNVYHHGPLYFLYVIAYFSGVIYLLLKILAISKRVEFKDFLVVFFSLIILVGGLLVQALFSEIRVDWLAAALASTMICLNYLTQDQKKAVEDMKKAMD